MVSNPSARVLVIDNDPRVRSDLQSMLTFVGYRTQVAEGAGDELIAHARRIAAHFRPHVAIVDLRLIDDYSSTDCSGLEMLDWLESARCILYSAYLSPALVRDARRTADTCTWISKSEAPQRLIEAVREAACQVCVQDGQLHIQQPQSCTSQAIVDTLFECEKDIEPGIVDDLLGQLFPSTRNITLKNLEGETTTPRSVGRGHSVVLKAWRDDRREPLILKLAPAKDTRKEWRNYERYIRDNLGGMYHAHLEAPPVTFWELGGTLYSFVGTALHGLPTFSLFYREHENAQDILHPLEHFFTQVWGGFYAEAPPERYPLYGAYNSVLNLDKRLADWPSRGGSILVDSLGNPMLDPVSFVLTHCRDEAHPQTRLAITHGDLHGDNLFMDDDHLWAIDFERTGPGPILRDFVELEVDVVTRLLELPNDDPNLLPDLVNELVAPTVPDASIRRDAFENAHPEVSKAVTIIEALRAMAHDLGGCNDNREYYWGLLLDALFVASLTTDQQPQRQRALVLVAALAERLDRWEAA